LCGIIIQSMKKLLLLSFILLISLACEDNCENIPEACTETPPKDELLFDVYLIHWFYNAKINACEEIQYNCDGHFGFATQEECETCICVK